MYKAIIIPRVCILGANVIAHRINSIFENAVMARDFFIAFRDISNGWRPTKEDAMQYRIRIPASTLSSIGAPGSIIGPQVNLVHHKSNENDPVINRKGGRVLWNS